MAETALVASDTRYPCDDYSHYRLIDLFKEVRQVMGQRHALDCDR